MAYKIKTTATNGKAPINTTHSSRSNTSPFKQGMEPPKAMQKSNEMEKPKRTRLAMTDPDLEKPSYMGRKPSKLEPTLSSPRAKGEDMKEERIGGLGRFDPNDPIFEDGKYIQDERGFINRNPEYRERLKLDRERIPKRPKRVREPQRGERDAEKAN